jgi:hypothetical protein
MKASWYQPRIFEFAPARRIAGNISRATNPRAQSAARKGGLFCINSHAADYTYFSQKVLSNLQSKRTREKIQSIK